MYAPANNLPDHSRIWIYQSSRPFSEDEVREISALTKDFLESWTAHNASLKAGFEIRYNHFLILMIDEKVAGASGCSIDKSVHFIQSLGKKFEVSFFDRMKFAYKTNGRVEAASRDVLEKLFAEHALNDDSIFFNNLVETKKELDSGWEISFKNSWHKNLIST